MSESTASSPRDWLTVSQAAAMLGKSERTIQRHCKSGKIMARLVTTDDGTEWQISPDEVTTGAAIVTPEREKVPPTVTTPIHAQNAAETPPMRENGGSVTTGDDSSDDTSRVLDAREELVVELRDQVKFLRSALEARDRDAAELRAALREALKAMPKALTEGETSTRSVVETSSQNAPQSPQIEPATKEARPVEKSERGPALRDLRTILKTLFGLK